MIIFGPAAIALLMFLGVRLQALFKAQKREKGKTLTNSPGPTDQKRAEEKRHPISQPPNPQLKEYKRLYHQLHNLESNPSVVPEAREALLSLFADTITSAKARAKNNSPEAATSILSIETFDPTALSTFIRKEEDSISTRLESYLQHRKSGAPRQLFQTAEEAKAWLISRAPSKLVDGAWLGHAHRMATTPFALRAITKSAWQVFSEELGDGDVGKNHAAIYRSLLPEDMPEANDAWFLEIAGMDDVATWRSAVTQLLVSLFPHEFVAEMLGFNLHFECLTWDTVRAALELRELRMDSYYFLLHISIDNSDSGHAKMALQVVVDYLQHVRDTQGDAAMQRAWRGVQAGYLLSASAVLEDTQDTHTQTKNGSLMVHNRFTPEMISIFQAKASVAAKLHCASAARIGKKKLSQWLEHGVLEMDFLDALAHAKPWVRPGDSERSRLVTELRWNGKMFGAFTDSELAVLCNWIDALEASPLTASDPSVYWDFVCRQPKPLDNTDVRTAPTVFHDRGLSTPWKKGHGGIDDTNFARKPLPMIQPGIETAKKLLPLWFAHAALLEGIVAIPIRTCDELGSAVVRVLRAQRGFAAEADGVAGMDEMRRVDSVGLVELGLEMARSAGLPRPSCLADVVPEGDDDGFAVDMLHWSMRPVRHRDALLGMAWAFVGLHEHLAESECGLLSGRAREVLGLMAGRERRALGVCREGMSAEGGCEFEAAAAFAWGKIAESLA